jgi:hypothetical protein
MLENGRDRQEAELDLPLKSPAPKNVRGQTDYACSQSRSYANRHPKPIVLIPVLPSPPVSELQSPFVHCSLRERLTPAT